MIATKGYDKAINNDLLLALPFHEASGLITQDVAKPHHPVTLRGTIPSWATIASGLGMLNFNGAGDYLDSPAADTADLDFTTDDYSIAVWEYHEWTAQSQIVIARYAVDLDGWELYFWDTGPINYLTLRHHHGSLATDRTGCGSIGWDNNTWHLIGISRSGAYPLHYRNGMGVEVTYDVGGLSDPDSCNRDLVIGARYTKNADWYKGMQWNPRVWSRRLQPWEHRAIFDAEREIFGL